MSNQCGNYDCADKSRCMKKGNTIDFVETDKSHIETVVMDVPTAAENDGKCKCGANWACTNCN